MPCCKPFSVCWLCTLGRAGMVPGFGELCDNGLYERTGLLHVSVADAQNRRRRLICERLGSDRPRGREDRGTGAGLSSGGDRRSGDRHGGCRVVSCKDGLRDREPLCGSGQCDSLGSGRSEPVRRKERVSLFPEHHDGGLRDCVLHLFPVVPVPVSFREEAAVSAGGHRHDGPVHLAS